MARLNQRPSREIKGDLVFEQSHPDCVNIYYQPSLEQLEGSGRNPDNAAAYKTKMLFVSPHIVILNPIYTLFYSDDFLKPKYKKLKAITLSGFGIDAPLSEPELMEAMELFPSGFSKDWEFGLGILREYHSIVNCVEAIDGVDHLLIYDDEPDEAPILELYVNTHFMTFDHFDTVRRAVKRIHNKHLSNGSVDKHIFAYNSIVSVLDPTKYPEKTIPYKPDTIFKHITNSAPVSVKDQKAIIDYVSKYKKGLVKTDPETLMKLHDDIELVSLEELIGKFELMLDSSLTEAKWQKLFFDNPFILTLAFGYPIFKIHEQACVGGRKFSGSGDKFSDFLVKNKTNNTALIEIKTPRTKLLNDKLYRSSVYSPSTDMMGAMNQLLDQRYKFQKEINSLKANSEDPDIESYSVDCVLIIGTTPQAKDQKKSFELLRGNSKDILIITFDEMLDKLKRLHTFLTSNEDKNNSVSLQADTKDPELTENFEVPF